MNEIVKFRLLAAAIIIFLLAVIILILFTISDWKDYSRKTKVISVSVATLLATCLTLCVISFIRVCSSPVISESRIWITVIVDLIIGFLLIKLIHK
jgi:hypothetical protein